MAFTYTFQNGIDVTNAFVKNAPTSALQATACDWVSSDMWTAFPWQWTLQNISPLILLSNGVQDYSVPTALYRMVTARIKRTDVSPVQYQELTLTEYLPPELILITGHTQIRMISHMLALGVLRLAFPISVSSPQVFYLDGEFQGNPPKVTTATLATNCWFPDQYFPVFCSGLLYWFYKFTDDSRAGTVVVDGRGNRSFSGQLGVFHDSLWAMRRAEDFKSGDAFSFPSDTLGSAPSRAFGIFGP